MAVPSSKAGSNSALLSVMVGAVESGEKESLTHSWETEKRTGWQDRTELPVCSIRVHKRCERLFW